jgi:hypothetical protein
MRQGNRNNKGDAKALARKKYAERQINHWIKWSMESRGYIKYKELVEIQNRYKIKCYG